MARQGVYAAAALLVLLCAAGTQAARELKTTTVQLPPGVSAEDLIAKLTVFRSASEDLAALFPSGSSVHATIHNLVAGIVGQIVHVLDLTDVLKLGSLPVTTPLGKLPAGLNLGKVVSGLPGGIQAGVNDLKVEDLLHTGGLGSLVHSLTVQVPYVGAPGGLTGAGGLGSVPVLGPLLGGAANPLLDAVFNITRGNGGSSGIGVGGLLNKLGLNGSPSIKLVG